MKPESIPVFILAGGRGTRITEETTLKPKPMVEIGDIPILIHLMRWYYSFGFNDFVICAGYRAWEIKRYFLTYEFRKNHLLIDHRTASDAPPVSLGRNHAQEKWRVRVIDTGVDCMTGARVARAFDEIAQTQEFSNFAVTYGDGLSNVDLKQELDFHLSHQQIGTVLGVPPLARFGELNLTSDNRVKSFVEKPQARQGLINGGFFFFKRNFRKYLSPNPDNIMEQAPLAKLAEDNELFMYPHKGFWQPMDTLRDKIHLESLWEEGKAPWRISEI